MIGNRRFIKFKGALPNLAKDIAYHLLLTARKLNAKQRCVPDFLVAGTQKGGTTSMFNYLIQHPQIIPPLRKAPQYYSVSWNKPLSFYKAHFPLESKRQRLQANLGKRLITGEGTPNYIYVVNCIEKIKALNPKLKIVFLLRNPSERAISDHNYGLKRNAQNALEKPLEKRIVDEISYLNNLDLSTFFHKDSIVDVVKDNAALLAPGLYFFQLKEWFRLFSKEQLLILKSEDFFENPKRSFDAVTDFLKIESHELEVFDKFNAGTGGAKAKHSGEIESQLNSFFAEHNTKLYELIARDMAWD